MSWLKNLTKFRQLSWADRGFLLEAICWLTITRLSLLLVPFRKISPHLGQSMQESEASTGYESGQTAKRIGWSVQVIARRTPWESACLAQAISAKRMLHRRRIPSTLYLGLAKDETKSLQAHAWLRCGEAIITGKAGHERFSVIATFAEQGPGTKPNTKSEKLSSSEEVAASTLQALLLAILSPTPQPGTTEQLRQLNEAEWTELIRAANRQHVLTLFFARLQVAKLETAVPPHNWLHMQQKQQQITLQNLAMYRELHFVCQKLQEENIPIILLKGAYLATAVYPHIGQRGMGDLDLLVPKKKLGQAADLLHELGWREIRPFVLETSLEHQHHLPAFAKKGTNFQIELHWNITHPNRAHSISSEQLWQQTNSVSFADSEALAFPPYLQVLHLAIHAAYNHQFTFDLRSLCDIATLLTQQADTLQWDQVIEKATAWGWQRGVYLTLLLVQDFWGTAVPTEVLTRLNPNNMPENMLDLAKHQILWGRQNHQKLSLNFSQLKSNKTLLEKAIFTLHFLVPSRNRLSWKYGVPRQSAKIWLYYFINLRDLTSRNARRTWNLLRGDSQITEAAERRNQVSSWLAQTK